MISQMVQGETLDIRVKQMLRKSFEVMDGGRAIGWVFAADGAPQAGPGAATVLLTRFSGSQPR